MQLSGEGQVYESKLRPSPKEPLRVFSWKVSTLLPQFRGFAQTTPGCPPSPLANLVPVTWYLEQSFLTTPTGALLHRAAARSQPAWATRDFLGRLRNLLASVSLSMKCHGTFHVGL